jgi:2-polyprenyl-3-methyl-5-hydroxy-6-metoxy-1,4-benzoquinol methylase
MNLSLKPMYDAMYADGKTMFSDTFIDKPELMKELLRDVVRDCFVLDFGCGAGDLAAWLVTDGGAASVIGTDYSQEAIDLASKRHLPQEHLTYLRSEGEPKGMWEAITCIGTLEHLDDPAASVVSFAEALERGGLLVLQVPAWMNRRGDIYHTLRTVMGFKMTLTDRHFFQPGDVPQMAEAAGLKVERTIGSHFRLAGGRRMLDDIANRLGAIEKEVGPMLNVAAFLDYFGPTPLFEAPLDVMAEIPGAKTETWYCDVWPWNQTGAATTYFLRKP